MQTTVRFKNKGKEWSVNLKLGFNGHADDKKAVRKAVMKEVGERWPDAKGYVQGIERKELR